MYFLIGKWIDFLTHEKNEYGTRDIISHGLHIFYPIFHCGLYCRAVYNAERLIFHDSFLTQP